ncbi:RNA-dependent RNA polymerase (RdRp) conserved catalytic core domain-containing protein [Kitasatospora sp. Ki12]
MDGLTVADVERQIGVFGFLHNLRAELKDGSFRPLPVREREIPKQGGSGKVRRLGIPTVADRVVQAALKLVLEPIFEADFKPVSYGFRPLRRAHDAISEIHLFGTERYQWVLDADIEACFDSISRSALIDRVRRRIKDKRVLTLVKAFLKAGVMTEHGRHEDSDTGTPQGGILSPLSANIALSELDEHVMGPWQPGGTMSSEKRRERRRQKGLPNWRLVRYADDFVVMVHGVREDVETLREQIASPTVRRPWWAVSPAGAPPRRPARWSPPRLLHPRAARPESPHAGLTLYQVLGLLQDLLKAWTGAEWRLPVAVPAVGPVRGLREELQGGCLVVPGAVEVAVPPRSDRQLSARVVRVFVEHRRQVGVVVVRAGCIIEVIGTQVGHVRAGDQHRGAAAPVVVGVPVEAQSARRAAAGALPVREVGVGGQVRRLYRRDGVRRHRQQSGRQGRHPGGTYESRLHGNSSTFVDRERIEPSDISTSSAKPWATSPERQLTVFVRKPGMVNVPEVDAPRTTAHPAQRARPNAPQPPTAPWRCPGSAHVTAV